MFNICGPNQIYLTGLHGGAFKLFPIFTVTGDIAATLFRCSHFCRQSLRNGIARSQNLCTWNFNVYCQTVFRKGWTIYPSSNSLALKFKSPSPSLENKAWVLLITASLVHSRLSKCFLSEWMGCQALALFSPKVEALMSPKGL